MKSVFVRIMHGAVSSDNIRYKRWASDEIHNAKGTTSRIIVCQLHDARCAKYDIEDFVNHHIGP